MSERHEERRRHILRSAYGLFRQKGFLRSGMDEIAAAAKVTKRTLYAYFESKDQLFSEIMTVQAELSAETFATVVSTHAGTPRTIVSGIFRDLSTWSSKPRYAGSGLTRVAVELTGMPGHPARVIARQHKQRLEMLLAGALADSGAKDAEKRARQIFTLVEGTMVMVLLHGEQNYVHSAAEFADQLLMLDEQQEDEDAVSGSTPSVVKDRVLR